jgi:hypothetical protein
MHTEKRLSFQPVLADIFGLEADILLEQMLELIGRGELDSAVDMHDRYFWIHHMPETYGVLITAQPEQDSQRVWYRIDYSCLLEFIADGKEQNGEHAD